MERPRWSVKPWPDAGSDFLPPRDRSNFTFPVMVAAKWCPFWASLAYFSWSCMFVTAKNNRNLRIRRPRPWPRDFGYIPVNLTLGEITSVQYLLFAEKLGSFYKKWSLLPSSSAQKITEFFPLVTNIVEYCKVASDRGKLEKKEVGCRLWWPGKIGKNLIIFKEL